MSAVLRHILPFERGGDDGGLRSEAEVQTCDHPEKRRLKAAIRLQPLRRLGHFPWLPWPLVLAVLGSATSLLFAQHDLLPRIGDRERVPVAVIEGTVADAVAPGRSVGFTSLPGAAMIMGVVLRPALFT